MRLLFSPEADRDVDAIDAWWREKRPEAPGLFAEELALTCAEILRKPLVLKPYRERRGVLIRRWLMRRTEQHVYFAADPERGVVTVLRVWGARRGREPRL